MMLQLSGSLPRSLSRWATLVSVVALLGLGACGDDPAPTPVDRPDTGIPDTGQDTGPVEDVSDVLDVTDDVDDGGDDTSDTDPQVPDVGPDIDPGDLLCPSDLRTSCMFMPLSCFGQGTVVDACVHFSDIFDREWDAVSFTNGSLAIYRTVVEGDTNYGEIEGYNAQGELCFIARSLTPGTVSDDWSVLDVFARNYKISLAQNEVEVYCEDEDETEICSRAKFERTFGFPNEWPTDCTPFSPQDQCNFDSDCESGRLCCRAGGDFQQCLDQETCLANRAPVLCDTNADCASGQTCSKCTRSGERECVPDSVATNPDNSLGCVDDACAVNDGTCTDPRICCLFADVFTCSVPSECDSPPDLNPVCTPSNQAPCANSEQNCCFVTQLNEFRCLTNVTSCQLDVCFGDADCPSNQECCGYNPASNTAGQCKNDCQGSATSCADHGDCTEGGTYCCKLPGYAVGQCVIQASDCDYTTCSGDNDCSGSHSCCEEAPLSEGVCAEANNCPPSF